MSHSLSIATLSKSTFVEQKYVGDFIYFYLENTKVPPSTTQFKALILKNKTEVEGRKEIFWLFLSDLTTLAHFNFI